MLEALAPTRQILAGLGGSVSDAALDLSGADEVFRTFRAFSFATFRGDVLAGEGRFDRSSGARRLWFADKVPGTRWSFGFLSELGAKLAQLLLPLRTDVPSAYSLRAQFRTGNM